MHCPVCKKAMVVLEFNRVEIDYCPSCQGCWLDEGELELLLRLEDEPLDLSDLPGGQKSNRRCPRCGKKMRKGPFPGTKVEVDICPRDGGIWLDRGELLSIAQSYASDRAVAQVKDFFANLFKT